MPLYLLCCVKTIGALRSSANSEHLNRSIEQFKAGKVTRRDLMDESPITVMD
ncbi:hypothetical protein HPTD01_456 [Halomonas sp. TD01]|nr:hypothetical protein HPTD01_456 [Halomonas sp. TD01]